MKRFKKSIGFTLAEVLITLGVIGIVAAMTIPNLVQNYKKQETSAKLRKFYSTMLNAVKLSETDNGDSLNWTLSDYYLRDENGNKIRDEKGNSTNDPIKVSENAYNDFMKYLAPYIKYVKIDKSVKPIIKDFSFNTTNVYFADGSALYLKLGDCLDMHYDINGVKDPNKINYDIYRFNICPNVRDNINKNYCGEQSKTAFCAGYYSPKYGDRHDEQKVLQFCSEDYKGEINACTVFLENNNWDFKKYPIKL